MAGGAAEKAVILPLLHPLTPVSETGGKLISDIKVFGVLRSALIQIFGKNSEIAVNEKYKTKAVKNTPAHQHIRKDAEHSANDQKAGKMVNAVASVHKSYQLVSHQKSPNLKITLSMSAYLAKVNKLNVNFSYLTILYDY